MKKFHLHLISDSTGETLTSVARSAVAQFDSISDEQHIWPLVRTRKQMDKVLNVVRENPGVVLYTVNDKDLRYPLEQLCLELGVPCIPVLYRVVSEMSRYLDIAPKTLPGKQYELDDDYFRKVEAINFALAHDDGQSTWDLDQADIVIVGVSRTSKTPTSVYLSYRGFLVANVPFVSGVALPFSPERLHVFTVGLTISKERLIQVRKNRLLSLHQEESNYVDDDVVSDELLEARKLYNKYNWPIVDVTRRSVEEVAAKIIQLHNDYKLSIKNKK